METTQARTTTGSAEQLAAMASTLFFNISDEWRLTDSYLSKFLNVSPLKLKSLRRKSAYFTEEQMLKVGVVLKLYNNITKLVGETKESKGTKSREFVHKAYEELSGGTLMEIMNQPHRLQNVVDFVETLVVYSVVE